MNSCIVPAYPGCVNIKLKPPAVYACGCARTRLRVMMDHVASVCSRPIPFPSPPSANTTVDSQESPDRDAERFRIALSLKEHIIGFRRQMKFLVCAPMDVKLYMYSCIYLFVCATRGRVPLLVVAHLVPRQLAFSDAKYMHAHTRTLTRAGRFAHGFTESRVISRWHRPIAGVYPRDYQYPRRT